MIPGIRILLGNDPRSYRQVQAHALRALRPAIDFVLAEPAEVDQMVAQLSPHLVVCSALSKAIAQRSPAWIILNPAAANLAVVNVAGVLRVIEQVTFEDLLGVIDETSRRIAAGESGTGQPTDGDGVAAIPGI